MLRRDDNCLDALGFAAVAVLYGYLALGVRAQVGHEVGMLADVAEFE